MEKWQWKLAVEASIVLTITGWISVMVSFWLPDVASQALLATGLCLGIPGAVGMACLFCFERELLEARGKKHPLRCTDCGRKVLNAGGEIRKLKSPDYWFEDEKEGRWKG